MTSDCTIVTSGYHGSIRITFISNNSVTQKACATGSIHDYIFCYCHLVGILFEVLRIDAHTGKLLSAIKYLEGDTYLCQGVTDTMQISNIPPLGGCKTYHPQMGGSVGTILNPHMLDL